MNKIYNLVYDRITLSWKVVGELSRGRTKSKTGARNGSAMAMLGTLILLGIPASGYAMPGDGGRNVSGGGGVGGSAGGQAGGFWGGGRSLW